MPRSEHPVSRTNISPNALRVLYRLKEAGFQAFLVGGCVRDIIIGRHPKDFDVATDALPEEVRRLFRNCRLVGRRFRLAHIVYGREIIEVATFRAASAPPPSEEPVPMRSDDEAELLEEELADADEDPLETTTPLDLTQPLGILATAEAGREVAPRNSAHRVHDDHGRLLRDNIYGSIDA
ncbi:MAG: hypothetical protein KGJ52_10390, partial [Gammaproteobacteria bacterium]|nr:hypothetical protein [Gammaproteobacteria bacterium]